MIYYETDYEVIYAVPVKLLRKFLHYMKMQKEKVTRIRKISENEKKYAVRVISCIDGTIMFEF